MVMVHIRENNVKHLEVNINELEINGKNKNTIDLYRGISELKGVTSSQLT
jgi:hypothetical protein